MTNQSKIMSTRQSGFSTPIPNKNLADLMENCSGKSGNIGNFATLKWIRSLRDVKNKRRKIFCF